LSTGVTHGEGAWARTVSDSGVQPPIPPATLTDSARGQPHVGSRCVVADNNEPNDSKGTRSYAGCEWPKWGSRQADNACRHDWRKRKRRASYRRTSQTQFPCQS
jgi:hypothetical protein